MNLFVALGIGFAVMVISPQGMAASGAGDIYDRCEGFPEGHSPNVCRAYIRSAVELLNDPEEAKRIGVRLCVPAGTPTRDLVVEFRKWVGASGARRQMGVVRAVARALRPKYGCR